MSISSQYKFSRVNLHKNNTQSPQFKLLKNGTEITVNSDNQYDSVIVELQSNPEVVDSIKFVQKVLKSFIEFKNYLRFEKPVGEICEMGQETRGHSSSS